jgi:hypothetical protein
MEEGEPWPSIGGKMSKRVQHVDLAVYNGRWQLKKHRFVKHDRERIGVVSKDSFNQG